MPQKQILSLPYTGPGWPDFHAEALRRVEGKTGRVVGDADTLGQILKSDGAPELLVVDFGWTGEVPRVLSEAFGAEGRQVPVLLIATHNVPGPRVENSLRSAMNIVGIIPSEIQATAAFPKAISAFFAASATMPGRTLTEKAYMAAFHAAVPEIPRHDTDFMMMAYRNAGPHHDEPAPAGM